VIILGVDPGTAHLGWAAVSYSSGKINSSSYGCIVSNKEAKDELRLLKLFGELGKIIHQYKPEFASVETLYFAANAKTAIPVGQARGIVLLACAMSNIPVISYSPREIKLAITGDGNATKEQIQYMICKLLKLKKTPKPDDAADALAIALTHAYSARLTFKFI